MHDISSIIRLPIQYLANALPTSLLERIENLAQKQLGKGSGAWSTEQEAKVVSQLLTKMGVTDIIAIDAGANLGSWTAEMLERIPSASIIAFEPSEVAFKKLSSRFESDPRVKVEKIALGATNSPATLFSDKGGSGLGSLTKRRLQHFGIEFNHSETVELQTLDTWIARNKLKSRPNVLKMDVEGHELDVLLGAKDSISEIRLIQFEFGGSNIDTRTFFQDFWYFFQDYNFTLFRLTPRKFVKVKKYSEQDEVFRPTNYVAIRE